MPTIGEQITSVYRSSEVMQKEINKWSKKGWKAVNQVVEKEPFQAGKGCILAVIFLPFVLFARGKNKYIVTYEYVGLPEKPEKKDNTNTKK